MSEIQHKSLKDELLYLIGRASAPLSSAELYEKCELADEVAKVAKAVANLQSDSKIVRVPGEGRARYQLASGVSAPAPAGKTGRSKAVQQDDARGRPVTGICPADIPILGDPGIGLNGAAGKTRRANPQNPQKPKSVEVNLTPESAALADAIISASREQLAPGLEGGPQWWIDQDGCLEISDLSDNGLLVEFSREQAHLMAEMILATHIVLEKSA